ncbi:MAG: HAMP domain-containing protein [Clostridia bacterium]|nr:HAMP domain-containing protein [Clostridia bacterium]
MKIRIRTKLLLTYLLLISLSFTVMAFAILGPLREYYLKDVEKGLKTNTFLVSRILIEPILEDDKGEIQKLVKEIGDQIGARITVINFHGEVLGETHHSVSRMENHKDRPEFATALEGEVGIATRFSETLETSHLYVARPLIYGGEVKAAIRLALPLLSVEKAWTLFRKPLLLGGAAAVLMAVILSLWLAGTFTRPIELISKTAQRIARGDWQQKIFISSNDELALLAQSINEMAASLKAQINEIATGKQRLEAVLNHMASGVMVIDNQSIIRMINPQVRQFFQFKGEALGKPYHNVIRNYNLVEQIDGLLERKEEKPAVFEITALYPDRLTLRAYAAPIIHAGKMDQIVIVFHDITALRRLEKMKTDFVANASHELRTPVASIKGFAETLLDGALEDEKVARRFVTIIDEEAGRLTKLINDLLDLSRIEAKGMAMEKSPTDIVSLLHECVAYLANQAQEKELEITIEASEQVPEVNVNREMLSRAFTNLLENSIKFTPPRGFIKITAAKKENKLVIKFSDTGIGIPKEDLPRIFERFYRVDKSRTTEGTGLGLSIVKHVIEGHQGRIDVQSQMGKGTLFTITLPL